MGQTERAWAVPEPGGGGLAAVAAGGGGGEGRDGAGATRRRGLRRSAWLPGQPAAKLGSRAGIRLPDAEPVSWEPEGKALHGSRDGTWTCAAQLCLRDLPDCFEPVSRRGVRVG